MRSLSAPYSLSVVKLRRLLDASMANPERCKIKGMISSFGRLDEAVGVSKTSGQTIRSLLVSAGLLVANVTQHSESLLDAKYLLCSKAGVLPGIYPSGDRWMLEGPDRRT
ncbi:hypothetical protein HO173_003450 [Letharia columbiana]|uniref:Uncharacterized protein n=1 Tax=Letharia columbiana TaxID=112416 RepID=A0A8H6L7K3_9LECA|nr:uncharacterized protein HO173_003450 [Letharia columbiana]KAF6238482.1 hypothetical protein HO173_003450 [Letharia columbiana]